MHWTYHHIETLPREGLQQIYDRLSPSRKDHIDRLKRQEDKICSLAGELLVQELLREHYGITTAVLHRKDSGQPYLTGCDLHISISHSNKMVACAVSRDPVGIDIEHIRPINLTMCRHVCTPEETAYLQTEILPGKTCHDPEILARFFEIWTGKEAYFKKQGTGIVNLKSVNILPLPRQVHQIDDYIIGIM